jgi:poly(beta-D-mannuronate) C5 epimerase
MVDCSVVGDYFGIYLAKMTGGRVVANRFLHSVIYGIDPHTYDSNLLIYGNRVAESGVHGIVLADHASRNRVIGNTILASKDHGIVIYQYSDGNIVERNRIRNTFDGIVVQDGSRNLVAKNVVGPVDRFALRISGLSYDNVVRDNTLGRAIVGAYLYQGPTGNRLLFNRFRRDYENVRIRVDAPGNTVRPWPQRSEIPR